MSEVKRQSNGHKPTNGLDKNPQNINRAGGPPKTHWWSELLKERAELETEVQIANGKMKKLKNKEIMANALIEKAKAGDITALKEFGDRVQGKAPQGVELSGTGENGAINVNIKMV